MRFQFIGRGAALNPLEGNNAVMYQEDGNLLLVDMGENVFTRLVELDVLSKAETIYVVLTHTHSDHSGSLGSLIHYCYVKLKKQIHLVLKDDLGYMGDVNSLLKAFQVSEHMLVRTTPEELAQAFDGFSALEYIPTRHVDELSCYALCFTTPEGMVLYTGDSRDLDMLRRLYQAGNLAAVYTDTHNDNRPISVHMPLDGLKEVFPPEFRSKVTCMHFGNQETIDLAREAGFSIAERIR